MEERFDKQTQERAVLVGLNADCFAEEDTATESTLDELEDLLETAGGFCTGKVLQNRHTPDSHSFIGEGKAQEVRMLAEATQSTMVIFDNELSPGNIRALEEIIGLPVLDRSALILDIFAQRAKTCLLPKWKEGLRFAASRWFSECNIQMYRTGVLLAR